jgi:hypothetical protein
MTSLSPAIPPGVIAKETGGKKATGRRNTLAAQPPTAGDVFCKAGFRASGMGQSPDVTPSQSLRRPQWPCVTPQSRYRCGGSAGIAPASQFSAVASGTLHAHDTQAGRKPYRKHDLGGRNSDRACRELQMQVLRGSFATQAPDLLVRLPGFRGDVGQGAAPPFLYVTHSVARKMAQPSQIYRQFLTETPRDLTPRKAGHRALWDYGLEGNPTSLPENMESDHGYACIYSGNQ